MKIRLQQLDVPTKRGNIWPSSMVRETFAKKNNQTMYGTFNTTDFLQISNIKNMACLINDVAIEDGYLVAECTVLKTPTGDIFQGLLDAGIDIDYGIYGRGFRVDGANINGARTIVNFEPLGVVIHPGAK